ncbi:MAG: hypothetical protein ABIN01_22465 [Ferruginibacter sp.]
MKFGNWEVSTDRIEWAGKSNNRFVIQRELLLETMMIEAQDDFLYKWIIVATQEEWLTEDDLYDLNFAFAFAAGATPENFSYETFDNTLEYQFNNLDEAEDDDEE